MNVQQGTQMIATILDFLFVQTTLVHMNVPAHMETSRAWELQAIRASVRVCFILFFLFLFGAKVLLQCGCPHGNLAWAVEVETVSCRVQ